MLGAALAVAEHVEYGFLPPLLLLLHRQSLLLLPQSCLDLEKENEIEVEILRRLLRPRESRIWGVRPILTTCPKNTRKNEPRVPKVQKCMCFRSRL
jgi:hypothetical protein